MKQSVKFSIGAIVGILLAVIIILFINIIPKDDKQGVGEKSIEETVLNKEESGGDSQGDESSEEVAEQQTTTIELAMVGDILLHTELAKYEDFTSSFAKMAPIMQKYDFLIANQESLPVASKFGVSSYPQFSSPDYIIQDLQETGVDMLNVANNHAVDKGEAGLAFAIENMERANIPYVGAYKDDADRQTKRIVEVDGIKIGFVSYTYETNGLYLPKDSSYSINYIDIAKMTADVEEIKPLVDVTVAIIHWGVEYVTTENDNQRYIADQMNKAGVDLIFGGHPHVLQPYSKITGANGQETHVFYSLGNYFSRTTSSEETMIGGIGSVEITKENGAITITHPKLIASSLLKDSDGIYRLYPLAETESRSIRDMAWVKNILGPDVDVQ